MGARRAGSFDDRDVTGAEAFQFRERQMNGGLSFGSAPLRQNGV
jgi:hypothetical protein